MSHITSSKHLLTALLESLRSINPTQPETTTANTQHQQLPHTSALRLLEGINHQTAKNTLLTLHFLFPHELLPALDLIDRRLITHLHTKTPEHNNQTHIDPTPEIEVYYVQSASASSDNASTGPSSSTARKGRFRNALSKAGMSYEIRLAAWNCTCPAFAYSALKLMMADTSVGHGHARESRAMAEPGLGLHEDPCRWGWLVGGVAAKGDVVVPVCKHILAVALVRAAPGLFGGGVVEREVSGEEMAGWAAGWGGH